MARANDQQYGRKSYYVYITLFFLNLSSAVPVFLIGNASHMEAVVSMNRWNPDYSLRNCNCCVKKKRPTEERKIINVPTLCI